MVDPSNLAPKELQPVSEGADFYYEAMRMLHESGVPFLVGGTYAFTRYTGITRHTKDLDIFTREEDVPRVLKILEQAGYRTDMTFPYWLAKAFCGNHFIDIIFSSANGVARVDDDWFKYALPQQVLGLPLQICPAEEIIWSKGFIMERERYDGADILHLIQAQAEHLEWERLLDRFGKNWRVLLSHLTLFGYVYPNETDRIPYWLMDELVGRLQKELAGHREKTPRQLCRGTILSREQFLYDVEEAGYRDARIQPVGTMTAQEVAHWTAAIDHEEA